MARINFNGYRASVRQDISRDFVALSSVDGLLKQVGAKQFVAEVYEDNEISHKGVKNDIWFPPMRCIGYVFEGLTRMRGDGEKIKTCKELQKKNLETTAGFSEYNACWC